MKTYIKIEALDNNDVHCEGQGEANKLLALGTILVKYIADNINMNAHDVLKFMDGCFTDVLDEVDAHDEDFNTEPEEIDWDAIPNLGLNKEDKKDE